jgi:ribonucleoside-diphosphate reductase alpha chain
MFNVGTGIEPFFRLEYVRTTKSLEGKEQEHRERPRIIQEYLNHIGKEDIDIKDLPDYFVSSDMIDYRQRIKLQAVLQKYTDTGISSTINLPKGTSVETIYELYMLAWKEGLKGVTVYVDGSREGILTENGNTPKGKRTKVHAKPRPKKIDAEYYPVRVKGENFGVIMGYLDDEPYEIFAIRPDKVYPQHFGTVTKVKKRVYKFESERMVVDNMVDPNTVSDSEGNTSLLVSAMLRHEMPVEFIADVVRKTSDSIVSYSSSLAKILDKHAKPRVLKDKCPDCGGDLIREGGCTHCSKCEYAKCGD